MSEAFDKLRIEIEAYADAKGTRNVTLIERAAKATLEAIGNFATETIKHYQSTHEKTNPTDAAGPADATNPKLCNEASGSVRSGSVGHDATDSHPTTGGEQ